MSPAPGGARRLGVYGGAFDPPHNAHVALAQAAVAQLSLDELRILPTGHASHKKASATPASHRLAMSRAAFEGLPRTAVDDREMRRQGATYTIDTLRELQGEHPGAELFLVIGGDQAEDLTQWRDWAAVLSLATLAVAQRPLPDGTLREVSLPAGARHVRLGLPSMEENSSEIRERIARGEGIGHLVPAAVARYIDQHFLYRTP